MKKLLLHLDTDDMASTFDAVVAYDAGADSLLSRAGVNEENVTDLVHGMIFTRGGKKLQNSAIFIGGSDVAASDAVGKVVKASFFGPVRVSVMLDPNGSNTTAAAIVRKIVTNHDIKKKKVVIIGAGPVGQRAALYFKQEGADEVILTSRKLARSEATVKRIKQHYEVDIRPAQAANETEIKSLLNDAHVAIAAGPAGVCILPEACWSASDTLQAIADVNALPPLGVEGIEVMDDGKIRNDIHFYGAIAIGKLKMRLHQYALTALFKQNDLFLDETTIYDIARQIDTAE